MDRVNISLIVIIFFLLLSVSNAETTEARDALVQFMQKLSPGENQREVNWGWNATSDPCEDGWKGVTCKKNSIKRIDLDNLNLNGELDAISLCTAKALTVLNLSSNDISGIFSEEILKCRSLTQIDLHGNIFSGSLPSSLSRLGNLKRLDFSHNGFSGIIPDLPRISGLLSFLAQENQLSGGIPSFDFSNLEFFNVSNNNLSGPIPDIGGKFDESSFSGNLGLCGKPFSEACPPPTPPPPEDNISIKKENFVYGGYALIGVIVACLLAYKLIKKRKAKAMKNSPQIASFDSRIDHAEAVVEKISEFSVPSVESGKGSSSSLVILSTPVANQLSFDDLMRAPAELIERGRNGTTYKVFISDVTTLSVKRVRDWEISVYDFTTRMQQMDAMKHPNVLPIVAFYCSTQERLIVYEFQKNGSLFSLLRGTQKGKTVDWQRRLSIAGKISEAVAFMHEGLQSAGISHGNIKSSNILFSNEMQPCISEYGLAALPDQKESFQQDTYNFGLVLLELLTGEPVLNNGYDLAKLMDSTIQQDLTAQVFDRSLVSDKEQMMRMMQLALKCVDSSPEARPGMGEVAEEMKSIDSRREILLSS